MMTLGDIVDYIKPSTAEKKVGTAGIIQDRQAYLDYATNVQTKGQEPLTYPEWVKAGRPAG